MNKDQQNAVLEATMRYAVNQLLETEKQLDDAIEHFDNMTPEEMEEIRLRRRKEILAFQQKKQKWEELGHGKYDEVYEHTEFFTEVKTNERVICHFYRPSNEHCTMLDQHLKKLAPLHLEARFIKINAEKAVVLCDKLNITILPSIVCTRNNKFLDVIEGFTDLGNTADFPTEALEKRLSAKGGIDFDEDAIRARKMKAQLDKQNAPSIRESEYHSMRAQILSTMENDDDDWLNDD